MADNKKERCWNCKYCHKHEDIEFRKGFCCTLFFLLENGPIFEVWADDRCECWESKGEMING